MTLGNTNISTYNVGSALGTNSRDIGTLCTHQNVNIWSKWKPIESTSDTLTLDELKNKKFGLTIIQSNTPSQLVAQINNNGEKGFKYIPPRTKYRLGDFRNYNSNAPVPCEKTYLDDEEINIGGVTSQNHGSYERDCGGIKTMSTDTTLGVDDLYYYYDSSGNKQKLHRGCYITDGNKSAWYTDKFYWWTNEMQYFANKTVTIYEFYTNCIKGSDGIIRHPNSNSTGAWSTDRFFAIPYPKYSKKIKSDTPAGSKVVATMLHAQFTNKVGSTEPYENISYNLYFDARGEVFRGGTIENVWIKLCRDNMGVDVIEQTKLAESLRIDDETRSKSFLGMFRNKPKDFNTPLSPNVWVIVWYNYQLQSRIIPLLEKPDIQQ